MHIVFPHHVIAIEHQSNKFKFKQLETKDVLHSINNYTGIRDDYKTNYIEFF